MVIKAAGTIPRSPMPRTQEREERSPTQEDRVVHFLQQFERAALRSTRYLSTACMGQLVGTTAGVLAFAPLANALGQIHVLTVGATLAGGIGAVAALALERARKPGLGSRAGDLALGAAAGLKSLPNFVYPTLQGATAEEEALIHRVLDGLPMGDVTSASSMTVMEGMGGMGISGVAPPALSQNVIYLDRKHLGYRWFNEELVTHELGHAKDLSAGYGPFGMLNQRTPPFGGPFGRAPFVSSYADTNLFEDYAESYTEFHRNPRHLQRVAPEKFALLEQQDPQGLSEWLTDRPSVRSAGKGVAQAVGTVPYLRNGLELALSLVGPLEVYRGSRQWEEGLEEHDSAQRARGKFNLATGLLLMTGGGAPFALAAAALHAAVKTEKAADLTLAASLGPLGMITLSAARELESAGFDLSKRIDSFGRKPADPDPFPAVASGVAGAAFGGAAGALVGSLSSGLGGAAFGAACGHLAGAAVGLGIYAMAGRGSHGPPPHRLDLQNQDKRLLAGIAGGALVGGVLGGTGGGYLGLSLGRALGGALGGPVGAGTGAFLGRLAGMLAGSAALGRAGAAVGRALICPEQMVDQAAEG